MNRFARPGFVTLAAILALAALAYAYRVEVVLEVVSAVSRQRYDVGPNRELEWQTGADPNDRVPAERPPNIILILADDLGWNDLTFAGGGTAGGSVPTPNIDSIAAEGA
ncbi:MAG: sulfatase, partial [bacterium]|nr:sulfatase [bacterium]